MEEKKVENRLKVVLEDKEKQLLIYEPKRHLFSCSQCNGTGDGPTPGSIQHETTCPYYWP